MRICVDVNVIVDAASGFSDAASFRAATQRPAPGTSAEMRLLCALMNGRFTLVSGPHIWTNSIRALCKQGWAENEATALVALIARGFAARGDKVMIDPGLTKPQTVALGRRFGLEEEVGFCEDAVVAAIAVAGNAEVLVTSDRGILNSAVPMRAAKAEELLREAHQGDIAALQAA